MTTVFNLNRYDKIVANDLSLNGSISSALGGLSQWDDSGSDIYFSGGNVGIGTSSPTEKLHIHNSSNNSSLIKVSNATSTNGFLIEQSTSTDTYIRNTESTGSLIFHAGNAEKMRIATDGNVGIGTTNPARLLHLSNDSGDTYFHMTCRDSGSSVSNGFSIVQTADNHVYISQRENAEMIFNTSNTERMRISSGGNVGIGTTSPLATLHLDTGATYTSYANKGVLFNNLEYTNTHVRTTDGTQTASDSSWTRIIWHTRKSGTDGSFGLGAPFCTSR